MKYQMYMWRQAILVSCLFVLSTADQKYENNLTKLWSLSSASNSDGSAVLNVTSASIVIQPSSYTSDNAISARKTKDLKVPQDYRAYAFKPRAIPLSKEEQPRIDNNVYYSQNNVNGKYKPEILFPGNYVPIAKEKGQEEENLMNESTFNPTEVSYFHPKSIPLLRSLGRSLDEDDEIATEKADGFSGQIASRRSLSYYLGAEDDDEEPVEDIEDEDDDEKDIKSGHGIHELHHLHKAKRKNKKITKYMMPLLLAYKLKYFALVPVMIAGLVLLVGSTGLAGFFFALFAAVMGLQKGSL